MGLNCLQARSQTVPSSWRARGEDSLFLMMEKAHARERHRNAVFVAGHDDMIIAHGATSLSDELHAALVGTLYVVAEWEESV